MKSKKIFIKIIGVILCIIMVVFVAVCCYIKYDIVETENLIIDIHHSGWSRNISYDMLSSELQEIISEEEFSDTNSQNRLAMYRKLENLIIDNRPIEKFNATTTGVKTPYVEFYETDGKKYQVDFRIDIDSHFGKMEVKNFCCYIHEVGNL